MIDGSFIKAIRSSVTIFLMITDGEPFLVCLKDGHVICNDQIFTTINPDQIEHSQTKKFTLPILIEEFMLSQKDGFELHYDVSIAAYVAVMATGGVEWNTISILSKINENSLIVSRIMPEIHAGDLNFEALCQGIPIFCNFGCDGSENQDFWGAIGKLLPKVLWICNWSVIDIVDNRKFELLPKSIRIVDQRSYDTKEGWIQTINTQSGKYIDLFIATNGLIKNELEDRLKRGSSKKIQTIRPVLRKTPNYAFRQPKENRIYQVARLSHQKRIDRGIQLFSELLIRGYEDSWIISGDGPLRSQLQDLALPYSSVEFIGFQPTFTLFSSMSGLVLSSDFEGLPMVVIETLAAGIPVFATSTGDLPWLRDQLLEFECELLTLSTINSEQELISDFLAWRKELHTIWNNVNRRKVAIRIKELFDIDSTVQLYMNAFGLENSDG